MFITTVTAGASIARMLLSLYMANMGFDLTHQGWSIAAGNHPKQADFGCLFISVGYVMLMAAIQFLARALGSKFSWQATWA
jgi:hypothetical protein